MIKVEFQDNDYIMLKTHLKASKIAFESDDYYYTTIYSNRIISDGLIMDDMKYGVIGFIIRNVALEYSSYQKIAVPKYKKKDTGTIKELGSKIFDGLENLKLTDEGNFEEIWNIFLKFENDFRKFKEFEDESDLTPAMGKNFSNFSLNWLISYISNHKEYLNVKGNNFLKGIVNDAERIATFVGYDLKLLLTISCLVAMDWTNDYVRRLYDIDKEIYVREISEIFLPAIDKIAGLVSAENIQVLEMTNLIWQFLKKWRELFLLFMDINVTFTVKEESPSLSREYREKLVDAISRSVSKGLKQND